MTSAEGPQSATDDEALRELRQAIDATDGEILALLQKRAGLALKVGEVKQRTGSPVYRPEREAAIFARLRQRSDGPLGGEALVRVWRQVISACRELERRMRVAFLGPVGTYSEMAVMRHFGGGVEAIACPSIDEVFRATEAGMADFGVVPVENSSEGAVSRTMDLLLDTTLTVSGEVLVPIHHCLMGRQERPDQIKTVCSHPQSLAQCGRWLDANLPDVERRAVSSNAEGARMAGEDPSLAAIAGEGAADLYKLGILRHGIQDNPDNRTRFLVIGRYVCAPSGDDQTSLIVSVPDRAGAVHSLIEPLARHSVSMKRFESRPARRRGWEYFFYIDLLGHADDPEVAAALVEIRANTTFFKQVGAYPRSGDA
ncbi:MAG: prephenate dehydratase [Burkholderiaceae bacterium]